MNIQRILVIGEDRYEWYAPAWKQALCGLDIDTRQYSYTTKWSKGLIGRVEQRLLWGPAITQINTEVLAICRAFKPDIILLYAAFPIRPSTVEALTTHAWVTTYHNDDPFGMLGNKAYFRHFKQALPYAHSHHVYREANVQDYRQRGVSRVAMLRSYYIPWLDIPPSLPLNESGIAHDVVFIGHCEADQRINYLQALVDARIKVNVYGTTQTWRATLPVVLYNQLKPIYPVYGEKYRHILVKSKLCLCFFSKANRDQYTRRVFEIPAVGGFLLSERTNTMQELYEEDAEAVYFSSNEELTEKVKYYLKNETARIKIAKAGQKRCLNSGYDVTSRMHQWLADIQSWIETSN